MPRATKETKKDEVNEEKKEKKSRVSAKKEATTEEKEKTTSKKSSSATKKNSTEKKSTSSTAKTKKTPTKKEEPEKEKTKASTKNKSETKEAKSKTKKASTTEKKETKASKTTSSKKVAEKTETPKKIKTATKAKKESKSSKSTTSKNAVKNIETPEEKETVTTKKKTSSKKSTTAKKTASKTTKVTKKKSTTTKSKILENNIVAEYYDLPYRYNETIVKILYQTPQVLFVYWDISDDDRTRFVDEYGEYFFNDTKPVLKIYNLTKNYNFEVEINDFANSWYINVNDANCNYKVELGRKPITYNNKITSDYIYVSSSNSIEFPNDHILIEELPNIVNFKNVKTNKITTKAISTLRLVGINKIYSVYDFYKKLYNDDIFEEINNKKILCSSSSTSSWSN